VRSSPSVQLALAISACLVLATGAALPARAQASTDGDDRGRVLGGVKSLHEIRWDGVVRQKLEVGCGASSLATIMTYYFGFPTTEQEMADAMMAEAAVDGQDNLVKLVGFSMAHIKRVAEKGGLVAQGFRVPIEHLDRIKIPVIARVSIKGYDHFLVFKGAQNGRIFVADPAFGNGSYRLASFEKIWSGLMIGFVRQGENPRDHLLMVEEKDALGEVYDRIAQRNRRAVKELTGPNTVSFNLSLMPPTIGELAPGLDSVFPHILNTRTRF
jgi:predicted double-glycine peptidase